MTVYETRPRMTFTTIKILMSVVNTSGTQVGTLAGRSARRKVMG
jgi:hypothetical protein